MKNKKVIGIVLLVIGIGALVGGFANGTLANMGNENIFTALTFIGLIAAAIVGGIVLIVKSKKKS